MQVIFYNNQSQLNSFPKTLTQPIQMDVALKHESDIMNPTIHLPYSSALSSVNYFYIPEYRRYYYVTNIETVNQRMFVHGEIDVLESYKDTILNSDALVVRAERRQKGANFHDVYYPVRSDRVIQVPKKIGSVGTGVNYYLTVAGGGA